MAPAQTFSALTVVCFIASCVSYRRKHRTAGDRLLYLAYGFMAGGYMALFESWGLLHR